MDTQTLDQQLLSHIQALEQEGIIDDYFRACLSFKEDSGLYFFLELVPIFFTDVRTVIRQMASALDQPVVDFDYLYGLCIKLKGSAGCIGACRVRHACSNLCQAIDNKSKDGCLQALNDISNEHHDLQSRLDTILQLERQIVSKESCQM